LTEVNGLNGEPQGMTLRDYAQVIVRRLWLILLIVAVATGAAFFFSSRQTKMYAATAKIMYTASLNVADPLTGQSYVDPNARAADLASVATVISSPDMQQRGAALVRTQEPAPAAFSVTAVVQSDSTTVNTGTNTVVDINGTSSAPATAEIAANAYAKSFIEWRKEIERAQIGSALDALKTRMAEFKTAVAQQSTEYLILVQRVQDLEIRKATVTGNFSFVVPASLPAAPYAPKPLRSAILGLAVGLFAAIGLAFLLEQLDTSIRTEDRLLGIMRQPILGRIPRIAKKALEHGVLLTISAPTSAAAEAFRMLRSNLDFTQVDGDLSSVLVTSSVQGEGKSVTACNLGVSLALAGKRIVVVDGDLRRPRVHAYFGLSNETGVSTVASGRTKLTDALQAVWLRPGNDNGPAAAASLADGGSANVPKLYVLSSGPLPPNPGEVVASKRFAAIVKQLEREADLVIVDSPAMLAVGDTAELASKVDGMVYLVDMKLMRRPMLEEAVRRLGQVPCRKLGLVVIRHSQNSAYYRRHYYYYTYGQDGGKQVKSRFGEKREKAPVES